MRCARGPRAVSDRRLDYSASGRWLPTTRIRAQTCFSKPRCKLTGGHSSLIENSLVGLGEWRELLDEAMETFRKLGAEVQDPFMPDAMHYNWSR